MLFGNADAPPGRAPARPARRRGARRRTRATRRAVVPPLLDEVVAAQHGDRSGVGPGPPLQAAHDQAERGARRRRRRRSARTSAWSRSSRPVRGSIGVAVLGDGQRHDPGGRRREGVEHGVGLAGSDERAGVHGGDDDAGAVRGDLDAPRSAGPARAAHRPPPRSGSRRRGCPTGRPARPAPARCTRPGGRGGSCRARGGRSRSRTPRAGAGVRRPGVLRLVSRIHAGHQSVMEPSRRRATGR